MRHGVAFLIGLALLVSTPQAGFARAKANVDAPPAGIVPTTATLSQVLRANDVAAGHLTKAGAVRYEVWKFSSAGVAGTERLIRRGTDYHSTIQSGPFTEEYGQLRDARWHVNENGVASDTTDIDLFSFIMFRLLQDASDPKNDVKLLGETVGAQPAYVVEVRIPQTQHPEWIFFDKHTALVVRTEQVFEDHRLVSVYDDYRTVQGLTEPAHIHDSEGTAALDDDYRRDSLAFASSGDDSQFARPMSHAAFVTIDHPVSLNARIVEGRVIVRLVIGSRGLDFELSSGDQHSYIDSDVARELALPTYGHVTQAEGDSIPYETEIDSATSAGLTLHHFALQALPFHYHPSEDTKVVGVLGYDFLSQGFVTVDYVNQHVSVSPNTVVALDPTGFDVVPVWFDDGRPFFTCTIGSHETKDVLLDSSVDSNYIFGSFSQQYPDAVVDAYYRRNHLHTVVPFAENGSYGQDLDFWVANVPSLLVGPMNFENYKIYATNYDAEQGDQPIDAVMGIPFLVFFDVSYDYAHNRVLLKQNAYFKRWFKTIKS